MEGLGNAARLSGTQGAAEFKTIPRLHDKPRGAEFIKFAKFRVSQSIECLKCAVRTKNVSRIKYVQHLPLSQSVHVASNKHIYLSSEHGTTPRIIFQWHVPGNDIHLPQAFSVVSHFFSNSTQ